MRKTIITALGLICCMLVSAQERKRVIDIDMMDGFRRDAESVFDTRFLEEDMLKLVLNKDVADSYDTVTTYRVNTSGITDQFKSGRCWLFSTLNILRAEMIAKYNMADFQFSQTYGQFWDVLEKSNRFLENVIENRNKPMDSRMNEWLSRGLMFRKICFLCLIVNQKC